MYWNSLLVTWKDILPTLQFNWSLLVYDDDDFPICRMGKEATPDENDECF